MYRKRLKNVYELLEAGNNKKVLQEVDKLVASTPPPTSCCGHSHAAPSSGKKKPAHSHSHHHESGGAGYDEQATLIIAKALKSLALVRTGKKQEADRLIDELLDSYTSDENALSVIMQYCKETHQLSKIVSFYENAVNKCQANPMLVGTQEHEEILSSLFYAYVRNRDFSKQQQIALKLYKQTNRMMFCYWNAASYAMMSKPELNDEYFQNSKLKPETSEQAGKTQQQQALYLQLAEKILQKACEEQKMEYNGEYLLYLNILEEKKKYDEALKVVEAFDEEENLSKLGVVDFKIKRKISYLKQLKNWSKLSETCEQFISAETNANLDDWLVYLDYMDATVSLISSKLDSNEPTEPVIDGVFSFLDKIKKRIESGADNKSEESKVPKAQAPYLARIELLYRLFKLNESSPKLNLNKEKFCLNLLMDFLADYVKVFANKPGFYYELVFFKELINKYNLQDFILGLLKELHDKNRPFTGIKSIYTCLSYWQAHSYFGKQAAMSKQALADLAVELESMFLEALNFGKDLLSTGFQYADEFIIMAVHVRYDLYKNFNETSNNLMQLIVNLKQALVYSPSNYQLKLLLLNLYSHLGSYESLQKMYDSMDIKNIQNYSTANLLLVHNIRLGALGASIATYDRMNNFFTSNLFDMANFLVNCYKYGTFLKAFEICSFMNTIRQSLTLNLCLTNHLVIDFILHSTNLVPVSGEITFTNQQQASDEEAIMNDFKSLKSKIDQHLKEIKNSSIVFDPETGLLTDDNQKLKELLVDHNDKDVLYHWDPAREQEVANKQYDFVVEEQRRLLKLRNVVVRFIDVCLNSWVSFPDQENDESLGKRFDLYKKKLLEFNYELKYEDGTSSEDLSDTSKEDVFDAKLKIYITKSGYLKRWSQLSLDKLLNLFVNLSSDLCQNEKFIESEQQNNQKNLTAYRDSLKGHFELLQKRFNSLLSVFQSQDEKQRQSFKIENVAKILECFSSSLESVSFIVTIFTLCLSSKNIKQIWSEKMVKSKKKKGLYLQYAASIDVLFEIYELLCQILYYFVNQLKHNICPSITALTEVHFSGVQPTIRYSQNTTTIVNPLNDVAQSYQKSFDELKNFFGAKLKYLLKFSNNTNSSQYPAIENLKIN